MLIWNARSFAVFAASLACVSAVALPAYAIGGPIAVCKHPVGLGLLALTAASIAEGACEAPGRMSAVSSKEASIIWWNLGHGCLILSCLQCFTLFASCSRAGAWTDIGFGIAVMAIGIAMRSAAILTLGRSFADSFSPVAEVRVRSGPYRIVRHPAEIGLLMTMAGFGIVMGGWCTATLAIFISTAVASVTRIFLEERAMERLASRTSASRP